MLNQFKLHLPTFEEVQETCKNSEAFFIKETEIKGYKAFLVDYRLASYSDFEDNKAYEYRGLTFVYNPITKDYDRHILLNKFFNLNETKNFMLDDVKNKKLIRVQEKLDGSIVSPIKLPNGDIVFKSKMSFISDQAIMSQDIYNDNQNIKDFVSYCLDNNTTPIFELVGYLNQVVVGYPMEKELRLIQLRRKDGTYLNKEMFNTFKAMFSINTAKELNLTLEEILELKENSKEDIEGWVLTFDDGQIVKVKTNAYFEKHGLLSPDNLRENLLVQSILNNTIDDIISNLVDSPKKDYIIEVQEKISKIFNHLVIEYKNLRAKYFLECQENKKDFAIKYKKERLFGFVMKKLDTSFRDVEKTAEESVKLFILDRTKKLNEAKKFIDNFEV